MRFELSRFVMGLGIITGMLASASEARAISIRHDVSQQLYFDLAAQFPAVGRIDRAGFGAWCTGNLVAPNKVLTAAHCTQGLNPGSVSFKLGNNVGAPTHTRSVSAISISPNYTGSEASDLSVITLSSPIVDVTPMIISSQDPVGKLGTMVGFGYNGNGLNFNFAFDNLKRAAQNTISIANNNTVRTDFDHPNGSTNTYAPSFPVDLEGTTAGGDSGGPITANFGYGEAIVGVLCCGFNNFSIDSRYGDISIWSPISRPVNVTYLQNQGLTVRTGALPGDFNGDDVYDCADIDALTTAIAAGTNPMIYDLDNNGVVNLADRDAWLTIAGAANLPSGNPYLIADANLDGIVDGQDFDIWNQSKFTVSSLYCNGDYNADGIVDGLDFIAWNENRFQSSQRGDDSLPMGTNRPFSQNSTVPEPSGMLISCGVILLSLSRRSV